MGSWKDSYGRPMIGFYVDEDYIYNNCPRLTNKWEVIVTGNGSLKEDANSEMVEYIKVLATAGKNLMKIPDPSCNIAAKRRRFSANAP